MIEPQEIRRRIVGALPDAQVKVQDMTGGGDHFEVEVVSTAFDGLIQLQRHRLVYEPLKDVLGGDLHALSLRTRTPGEE